MKKILFALAAVVMLAPACTQDLTDGQNGGTVEMKKVTFGVSFEQPEFVSEDGTRISLNDENQIVWEEGDKVIIVYTPTGGSITSTEAEVDGGFVGMPIDEPIMFEFSLPADGNYTVHYAYSSKCTHDQFTAERLRPRFSVVGGSTGTDANNCAAYTDFGKVVRDCFATGAVNTTDKTITLRNSAAFFEVKLTGNGEVVWSVDVLSKSQNLRSKYAYIYNPASENPTLAIYQSLEPTNETASSMGGAHFYATGYTPEPLSSTPTSYYFAMPVQDFPAGDLFIQVRTGDYTRLYRASKAHSFKRNHVTVLKPIEVKLIDTDAHDYQPLDADGLSNCYMVAPSTTEDKYYSFSIKNVNGATEIYNGLTKNYGVWPMWATKDGLVEDISVIYGDGHGENGRVYFKVPAGTGNGSCMLNGGPLNSVLIGTNWAWHIWITDAVNQTIASGDNALTFLDRGPGALWTPKSKAEVEAMTGETAAQTVGFMYQYGRHIPFPGPKSLQSLSGNDKWGYESCDSDGSGSVGRFKSNTPAVELYHFARWQNGFTVYGHTSKDIVGTKYYNMQFLQYNGTWATDLTQDVVKNATGSENTWLVNEKGNQDPCPQGYRVATFKELIRIFRLPASNDVVNNTANYCPINCYSTGLSTGKNYWRWVDGTKGTTMTDSFGGYVHSIDATAKAALNGEFIWLPYGGMRLQYRDDSNHRNVGSLFYAGMWDNENDGKTIKTGYAFLWGVCDYYHTKLDTATSIYMPGTNIASYFKTAIVRVPAAFVGNSDNVWNVSSITTPFPASDAMPVRCVKMASASGEAQVSSLAAKQADANAWN